MKAHRAEFSIAPEVARSVTFFLDIDIPQRILRVAEAIPLAMGGGGSGAAGADSPDPRRVPRYLRGAPHPGGSSRAGGSGEPSQDRSPDEDGRPSRRLPTSPMDHHAIGRIRGGRGSGRAPVRGRASERALGGVRDLRSDGGGDAVSGDGAGRVLAPHRGLVHGLAAEGGSDDPRPRDGRRATPTTEQGDASFRSRIAVHVGQLRKGVRGRQRHDLDGLGGRLLRQRDGGKLLRHSGDRADRSAAWKSLCGSSAGEVDDFRLSRGVLQHAETAFRSGIPVSRGIRTATRESEMNETQIEKCKNFHKKAACGNVDNSGELPTFPRGPTTTIFSVSTDL